MIQKKKQQDQIAEIISTLHELSEDKAVPRNVKTKIEETIKVLSQNIELSIRINKALNYLDEISDDGNLQSYTRTQIWNIASLLEKIFT